MYTRARQHNPDAATAKDIMTDTTVVEPNRVAYTEHIWITPAMAEEWLEKHNRHNRPIQPWHWRDLAEDMKDHRFLDHGENGVRFDWDGYLCGGQHTLTAIKNSGETVRLAVTRNVDPAARGYMNDSLKQRFSHDLATMGVQKHQQQLEALTRVALLWDRTALLHKGHGGIATFRTTGKYSRPTLVNEWPKYAESCVDTMNQTSKWNNNEYWPGNRGAMQFTYWLLVHRFDCTHEAVAEYFDKICFGSSDDHDKMLFVKLRAKFKDSEDKHNQVYWLLRVWNAYRNHEHLSKLQAPKGTVDERGRMILKDPYPRPVKAR